MESGYCASIMLRGELKTSSIEITTIGRNQLF
jgi:hypothetical protein